MTYLAGKPARNNKMVRRHLVPKPLALCVFKHPKGNKRVFTTFIKTTISFPFLFGLNLHNSKLQGSCQQKIKKFYLLFVLFLSYFILLSLFLQKTRHE